MFFSLGHNGAMVSTPNSQPKLVPKDPGSILTTDKKIKYVYIFANMFSSLTDTKSEN
jgi:hypothetical protein